MERTYLLQAAHVRVIDVRKRANSLQILLVNFLPSLPSNEQRATSQPMPFKSSMTISLYFFKAFIMYWNRLPPPGWYWLDLE